jgi:dihydrofolate reductase
MTEGYTRAAIIGGAAVNRQYLEAGLVDTLYLTIEPVIFGQGLHLFDAPVETKLHLNQIHTLSPQTLVLEYQVLKS